MKTLKNRMKGAPTKVATFCYNKRKRGSSKRLQGKFGSDFGAAKYKK
jgi:hypothetical protein